jgi:hypothetical protein
MGLPPNPPGIETSGGTCGELTTGAGDWPDAEAAMVRDSKQTQVKRVGKPNSQENRVQLIFVIIHLTIEGSV